ncbi:hypothetical protein [Silvimonas soli]|uniref:hypothetical protein n=1 Tax=Silvimonas soli TaxID=2980100 RepID=UPI0024B3A2A1|nr:hypothetical protein [Silvimonas soli]
MMRHVVLFTGLCLIASQSIADVVDYDNLDGQHLSRVERTMFNNGFHQTSEYNSGNTFHEVFYNDDAKEEVAMDFRNGRLDSHHVTHKNDDHHDNGSQHRVAERNKNVAMGVALAAALGVGLYALNQHKKDQLSDQTSDTSGSRVQLSTLTGSRASGGEQFLTNNGFALSRSSGLTNYWYNQSTGQCAQIRTSNGRYSDVADVAIENCK